MADIQFEVENIEAVEEELREAYVEKDGKFRFDPDKYHELRAKPLIAKNKELIGKHKTLAETVKTLEKVKGSAATDVEKVAEQKDQEIATLKRQLRESSIWTPVQQLAVKHGVMPDRLEHVMTVLRAQDRFDQDAEGRLIYKDKYGDETAIKPERAFEYYLKEEMPWAFTASQSGGSGSKPGAKGGGSRVIPRDAFDALPESEKEARISQGYRITDR